MPLSAPPPPTTFTKNRQRVLDDEVMGRVLKKLMASSVRSPDMPETECPLDTGQLLGARAQKTLNAGTLKK